MPNTAGEVGMNSKAIYSSESHHMDEQIQDNQLEPIYNSSVPIQDVTWRASRERRKLETGGERGSGRSLMAV